MKIIKNVDPEYFQAILDGKKHYELRLGDFEINPGDTLVLKEWFKEKKEFTGREVAKEITYIRKFKPYELYWSKEEIDKYGIQIISFK